MKGQLSQAGLYSSMTPPTAYYEGEVVSNQTVHIAGSVTISLVNTNGEGGFWYTLDGTDPRSVGGAVSGSAVFSAGENLVFNLQNSEVIKARIRTGDQWSPITEVIAVVDDEDYSGLVVTELQYHPWDLVLEGDSLFSKDLEFIEFKNIGSSAINLAGLVLDSAVYYEFPDDVVLPRGQFYVVASKPASFYRAYGLVPSGNFKKNLSNSGEEILLEDRNGNSVIDFIYSDDNPWPQYADGSGYSLVSFSRIPDGDPSDPAYWRNSGMEWGSPFADDSFASGVARKDREIPSIHIYPNPTSGILHIDLPEMEGNSEATLHLYGINGNLIYQETLHGSSTINMEQLGLATGFYFVRIRTSDQVQAEKIIYR